MSAWVVLRVQLVTGSPFRLVSAMTLPLAQAETKGVSTAWANWAAVGQLSPLRLVAAVVLMAVARFWAMLCGVSFCPQVTAAAGQRMGREYGAWEILQRRANPRRQICGSWQRNGGSRKQIATSCPQRPNPPLSYNERWA